MKTGNPANPDTVFEKTKAQIFLPKENHNDTVFPKKYIGTGWATSWTFYKWGNITLRDFTLFI